MRTTVTLDPDVERLLKTTAHESPVAQWIEPDETHLDRVKTMLFQVGTGGNLVTDAPIAAYGQQCNATVCSADSDFRRFAVKWVNPLAPR